MTAGQQAIADGFAVTLAEHGQTWSRTSDGELFFGAAATLKADSPHMAGAQDMNFPVLFADSTMPTPRLKKGDELTKSSKKFRVVRADYEEATAQWIVILSPTF